MHAVAGCRIFKVMFEIVCGPWALEFFQAENVVALAILNMDEVFVGGFCFDNKKGNFGNTWSTILMLFIFF